MNFLLAVLSLPGVFAGEPGMLEALLEAGADRLHLRKPGATDAELEELVRRLAPRWGRQLVLHGPRACELALRYGVANVHGSVAFADGRKSDGRPRQRGASGPMGSGAGGPAERSGGGPFVGEGHGLIVSTSVHSWEELRLLPEGLAYAFISPVFDSISKQGYVANTALLHRPEWEMPCRPVALGGVGAATIGELQKYGWDGAAVLGSIWEEPGEAVRRFGELKKLMDGNS